MPAPVGVRAGSRAARRRAEHPGRASRDHHPSKSNTPDAAAPAASGARRARLPATARVRGETPRVQIPSDATSLDLRVGARTVRLTNLHKLFWPDERITKGDLVRYYAEVA